jgi:hypothetical protein
MKLEVKPETVPEKVELELEMRRPEELELYLEKKAGAKTTPEMNPEINEPSGLSLLSLSSGLLLLSLSGLLALSGQLSSPGRSLDSSCR